jgi:hypothetical protein
MSPVAAFTCQQCGLDFPSVGGGTCPGCKRLLCASHFARPEGDLGVDDQTKLMCDDCQAGGPPARAKAGRSTR